MKSELTTAKVQKKMNKKQKKKKKLDQRHTYAMNDRIIRFDFE